MQGLDDQCWIHAKKKRGGYQPAPRSNITYKQTNANYWGSEAGQKKLAQMRQPRVMLTNDTGADFCLCHGQGVSTILKPGEKRDFGCNDGRVYLGEKIPNQSNLKQTNKLLLDLQGTNCGAKLNASALLK